VKPVPAAAGLLLVQSSAWRCSAGDRTRCSSFDSVTVTASPDEGVRGLLRALEDAQMDD